MLPRWRITVFGLMCAHVCITSGGYLFTKIGLADFTPLAFAFWRFLFGLAIVGLIIILRKDWPHIERRDWPRVVLLGTLAVPANQFLYLFGMRHTVPSHASLIYGSTAVVALGLSTAIGYEKLSRLKVISIGTALAGLILVVSSSRTPILGTENFAGDLLVAASMIAWAGYTVLAKPIVARYGAVQSTLACLLVGSFVGLPFLIAPALLQDYSVVTWHGWSGVVYTGVFVTGIAYLLWFAMLKRVDPSQVAILTTPQPVVATALSVLILGETLGWPLIAGGLLVIGGVLLMHVPSFVNRKTQARTL
jgi:drug/metabolite transporter (DMT)-like permease